MGVYHYFLCCRLLPALRPGIAAHFTSSAIVQQAKKKAGAPAAAAAAVAEEKYDLTKQIPVNLAKGEASRRSARWS